MNRVKIGMAILAALTVVAAGSSVVYANVTSDGVINGCINDRTFVLTVPTDPTCPRGTTAVTWNQRGPAGPAGPSGYELVELTDHHINFSEGGVKYVDVYVACPPGKVAVGGGVREAWIGPFGARTERAEVHASYPSFESLRSEGQWRATLGNRDGTDLTYGEAIEYTLHAVCINGEG
jgi:hypothetical protein